MPVAVVEVLYRVRLLHRVVAEAVEMEEPLALVAMELQALVVEAAVLGQREAQAAQAALALSSSNIKHLLNPYSHSKVLAHGLRLLA